MELSEFLDAVERDGRQVSVLARGDLSAAVPPCPAWDLGALVGHLGRVYSMVSRALPGAGAAPDRSALPDPPSGEDVREWFDERLDEVLGHFAATDPRAAAWNWSTGPQVASFWWRRMAQETAVHLWDAQSAAGRTRPIDPVLASDGIDEWFDVHLRSDLADGSVAVPEALGSLHVHCTDVEGEWWAQVEGTSLELERAHRKGDGVMRGDASTLLLALWRREPVSRVEVLGDEAVIDRWLELPDI